MTLPCQKLFNTIGKTPIPVIIDKILYRKKYKVGIIGWWYNL